MRNHVSFNRGGCSVAAAGIAAVLIVLLLPTAALGQVDDGLPGGGWQPSLSTGRIVVLGSVVELLALDSHGPPAATPRCRPRPRLLTPMLVAHTGLQLADAHSTLRGIDAGAAEGNPSPVARWAVSSGPRLYALKGGVAAATWWVADRIACQRPGLSFWTVTALNGLYAAVVSHNYRVGSSLLAR